MKKAVLFSVLTFLFCHCIAQSLMTKDVCLLKMDLAARKNVCLDKSGKECAMIRVNIPSVKNIKFSTDDVVSEQYLPGEYILYVSEGTQRINYTVDGIKGYIDFSAFDIDIQSKMVYRCTMQKALNQTKTSKRTGTLRVETDPECAIILLDGIPMGESPITLENIPAGRHILSIPNINNMSIPDSSVFVRENELLSLSISLNPTKIDYSLNLTPVYWPDGNPSYSCFNTIEKDGKVGLVDLTGKILVPCEFDNVVLHEGPNGVFWVWKDHKMGVYKPGVGLVIPIEYNSIYYTNRKNIIRVSKTDKSGEMKYGYINSNGIALTPCIFDSAPDFISDDGIVCVSRMFKKGYLKIGESMVTEMCPIILRAASQFDNGVAMVRLPDKSNYSIIDKNGYYKNLPNYYYADLSTLDIGYTDGLCAVKKNGKWGFVNKDGIEVVPCNYEGVCALFYEGGAVVEGPLPNKNQIGRLLIKKDGTIIGTEDNIATLKGFSYYPGNCHVELYDGYRSFEYIDNGKRGIIRRDGKEIIPCDDYEKIEQGRGGLYMAYKNGAKLVYDRNGKFLFECPQNLTFSDVDWKNEMIMVTDEETQTYGFANFKGDLIANCIYTLNEEITSLISSGVSIISDGMGMLILGDRYGFINKKGEIVVPLVYNGAIPFRKGKSYVRNKEGNWIILKSDYYSR